MKTPTTGVQTSYTEDELLRHIWVLKLSGKSLRAIARDEFPGLTHADIHRAIETGAFPKSPKKRKLFRLSALASAPVCAKCGELHVSQRCTKHTPGPKRAQLPQVETPKVKGQPYKIRDIIPAAWITPQTPEGPALVIIERTNHDNLPANHHG